MRITSLISSNYFLPEFPRLASSQEASFIVRSITSQGNVLCTTFYAGWRPQILLFLVTFVDTHRFTLFKIMADSHDTKPFPVDSSSFQQQSFLCSLLFKRDLRKATEWMKDKKKNWYLLSALLSECNSIGYFAINQGRKFFFFNFCSFVFIDYSRLLFFFSLSFIL